MTSNRFAALRAAGAAAILVASVTLPVLADGGVTYTNIAPTAGVTFQHGPSLREPVRQSVINSAQPNPGPSLPASTINTLRANTPEKSHGAPGVLVFDYDNDGDQDIYVANGPGRDNALYQSQFTQTGSVSFVDVAAAAGVTLNSQDTSGLCAGDIDNDGDVDVYALGLAMPHHLLENNGNGTFTDITASAGVAGNLRHAIACSMGDLNADGLLDIVIGNTYQTWAHRIPVFGGSTATWPGLEHKEVYVNHGGNVFTDDSLAMGLQNVSNMSGPGLTGAAHAWAVAVADVDLDGDVDVVSADNQGPPFTNQSERRGWNRIYLNDGAGNFTDWTVQYGLDKEGAWMGLSFGDVECNGTLDFFSTSMGNYLGGPNAQSGLFIRNANNTYTWANQVAGSPISRNPFGWGTVMIDYDNDADTDIAYHGGMDILNLIGKDNPGVVFRNTGVCSGIYSWDRTALGTTDHLHRVVEGVATGDLNDDGFYDLVTVSSFDIAPGNPAFVPFTRLTGPVDPGGFDTVASFQNILTARTFPGFLVPVNPFPTLLDGTLTVEMNSAGNGNNWVKVKVLGTAGILERNEEHYPNKPINRDGIGAIVKFTPAGGPTSMQPVLGGSSYASQNELAVGFGLGAATSGTVDVITPGGFRNRLYNVAAGERLRFPMVPCSYNDPNWRKRSDYETCVNHALNDFKHAGLITNAERQRFRDSARQAWEDTH